MIYGLPADTRSLSEDVPKHEELSGGALQGVNSAGDQLHGTVPPDTVGSYGGRPAGLHGYAKLCPVPLTYRPYPSLTSISKP